MKTWDILCSGDEMKNNIDDVSNEKSDVIDNNSDLNNLFNSHVDFDQYENSENDIQEDWIYDIEENWEDSIDLKDMLNGSVLYQEAEAAYKPVDTHIIQFISNFVDSQDKTSKQKCLLKTIFFYITMAIFVIVVCTPIVTIIALYYIRPENSIVILAAVTASIIEVLVSIIVLPKIVAEYLFNKEEDVANVKIVELMKAYSETMHGYDNK